MMLLAGGMHVSVIMIMLVMVRMTSEQMNVPMAALDLANEIENPKRDQRATGQKRKCPADPAVNRNPAPNHQHSERSREQSVARSREAGNGERFSVVPMLGPGRDHERKPVRWNYRMEESNGKTGGNKSYENDVVHFRVRVRLIGHFNAPPPQANEPGDKAAQDQANDGTHATAAKLIEKIRQQHKPNL